MIYRLKERFINKNFYLKLITSTLIISILPLFIFSLLSYYSSKKVIENELYNLNTIYLKQTMNAIEIIMNQIDINCKQLILDNTLKNFINYPDGTYYEKIVGEFNEKDLPSLFRYIDTKRLIFEKLNLFKLSNEFISSVYIYDYKKNIILTSSGIQYSFNEFYDTEWFSLIQDNKNWPCFSDIRYIKQNNEQMQKVVSIIYKLFDSENVFVINLDAEYLKRSIIGKLGNETNTIILVLSDTGSVILTNGNTVDNQLIDDLLMADGDIKISDSYIKKVDNRKFMVNYVKTIVPSWIFVSVVDLDDIYESVNYIAKIRSLALIILLVVTGLLTFISSRNIYKPIYLLIQFIKKKETNNKTEDFSDSLSVSEFKYIFNRLKNAFNEKEKLEKRLLETIPAMKERFLYSLVKGKIYDTSDLKKIEEKIEFLNMKIKLSDLLLMILEIESYQFPKTSVTENSLDKLRIISIIENKLCLKYYGTVAEIEEDKFVIVINCDRKEIQNVLYLAQKLIEELKNDLKVVSTIGVGQYCNSIIDLPKAYQEAEEALKYRIIVGCNEVIYIEDIKLNDKQKYYYPKQVEIELNNYLKNGDEKNALACFDVIVDIVKSHWKNIHYNQVQKTFIQLLTSIINTIDNLGIDFETILGEDTSVYGELLRMDDINNIVAYFRELISKSSRYIAKAYEEKNNRHIESIMVLLNNDCVDNISLNVIAEKLHMNPSYISRLFKEKTGMTFNKYLTSTRLEKGKLMLLNTNLTIQEISKKLGYNNSYYFIKLFKEYTGVTPGNFRKIYTSN